MSVNPDESAEAQDSAEPAVEDPSSGAAPDGQAELALVEVSPGTALAFGQVPDGLDLIPFRLISPDDRQAIVTSVAAASSILNVGGQLAQGLAQAQGLVRLAPQTLKALQSGATFMQSGGYSLGPLMQNGRIVAQARFLPAVGASAAGVVASLGPALALVAIQAQLNEVSRLVKQNLALTETVLKSVRNAQWAELTGLEKAVTKALREATKVGRVTQLVWENVAGLEAELGKQRDLFKRDVATHAAALAGLKGHQERHQYMDTNAEAILLDVYSLLVAHKAWFEYQALRAGRARASADTDPNDAKLLEAIVDDARQEHDALLEEMAEVLGPLTRELSILAELPGKRTIPFTGERRSARQAADMAQQLLSEVERLSSSVYRLPVVPAEPPTRHVPDPARLDRDLRILRWHLRPGEDVAAVAEARQYAADSGLDAITNERVVIALTSQRVLVANAAEFRKEGVVERAIPTEDIRYVRVRADAAAKPTEIDLITVTDNLTWRFSRTAEADGSTRELAALLATHMNTPPGERAALLTNLPCPAIEPAGPAA